MGKRDGEERYYEGALGVAMVRATVCQTHLFCGAVLTICPPGEVIWL